MAQRALRVRVRPVGAAVQQPRRRGSEAAATRLSSRLQTATPLYYSAWPSRHGAPAVCSSRQWTSDHGEATRPDPGRRRIRLISQSALIRGAVWIRLASRI